MFSFRGRKTEKVAGIIRNHCKNGIQSILVVGCGAGIEAAVLADQLKAKVIGIDIVENFNAEAEKYATLQKGDAMDLVFDDESFDFIYSYHALEHIQDPVKALKEMRRVLRKGGGYWIGTPNRSRLVGYIGSQGVSLKDKIAWNLADWRARLTGKFRNEHGAHAGFSSGELRNLLTQSFPVVEEMTMRYFLTIYKQHEGLIKTIDYLGLSRVAFPSVYFYGTK